MDQELFIKIAAPLAVAVLTFLGSIVRKRMKQFFQRVNSAISCLTDIKKEIDIMQEGNKSLKEAVRLLFRSNRVLLSKQEKYGNNGDIKEVTREIDEYLRDNAIR